MKLSKIKTILDTLTNVEFNIETGAKVPRHYHITEIGQVNKRFIDCGGTKRNDTFIVFQLWTASDYDHRLSAEKLKSIINLSESKLQLDDLDVIVEYQSDTIGTYDLDFDGKSFILKNKLTDCLAKDKCTKPKVKKRIKLSSLSNTEVNCVPNSGCC